MENRKMIDFYLRFKRFYLRDIKVKYWLTFNEINMLTQDLVLVFCRNAGPEGWVCEQEPLSGSKCITSFGKCTCSFITHEIDPSLYA